MNTTMSDDDKREGRIPEDAIVLSDGDEDDEKDNTSINNKDRADNKSLAGRKRPLSALEQTSANDSKKNVDDSIVSCEGCMLHPKAPIKIFATLQDEQIRKTLSDEEAKTHWSCQHCWTLREMLGLDRMSKDGILGNKSDIKSSNIGIDFIFLTTYLLDVDFLFNEVGHEFVHIPIVIIIHHYKDMSEGTERWWKNQAQRLGHTLLFIERNPRQEPNSSANPLSMTMDYGCHHTKMFIIGYTSKQRLRVIIHTSNLRYNDVHLKCQGAYIQDFIPKTDDQISNFVSSNFEESLITYMESYHLLQPLQWRQDIPACTLVSYLQTYDFSTAVAVLIPSTPGYHPTNLIASKKQEGKDKIMGYLKVQQSIRDYCADSDTISSNAGGSIICQFSSMGSLSVPYLDKIAIAWNVKTAYNNSPSFYTKQRGISSCLLKIVWPTMQEIITSVEGPNGGGSVPGRSNCLQKPFLQPMLHKWKSITKESDLEKGDHVPHIKTYYQIHKDNNNDNDNEELMEWFVLSSHNLSKAAWGEIQNRRDRGQVLVVQHWELGVFLSPRTLGVDVLGIAKDNGTTYQGRKPGSKYNDATSKSRAVIPLPFKFRPDKYQAADQPWVVDAGAGL